MPEIKRMNRKKIYITTDSSCSFSYFTH